MGGGLRSLNTWVVSKRLECGALGKSNGGLSATTDGEEGGSAVLAAPLSEVVAVELALPLRKRRKEEEEVGPPTPSLSLLLALESIPLPLAFAFGCVWGSARQADGGGAVGPPPAPRCD